MLNTLHGNIQFMEKINRLIYANIQYTFMIAAGADYSNPSCTKLELEKAIQKWLKRAKERYDAERKRLEALETCENST